MARDVIIACDFNNEKDFWSFLKKFPNNKPFLKIGYELFYASGKYLIIKLINDGYKVFLDLKLHDIPNTVIGAIKSLNDYRVDFISLHAVGGNNMMCEAKKVCNSHTKLVAITQLTSTDQQMLTNDLLIDRKINDVIYHYAVNALNSGIDGVVCAAGESAYIKQHISNDLITICPGIRLKKTNCQDQKRVYTPAEAYKQKVDYIVVGREITKAKNPLATYLKIKKEFLNE